MQGPGKRVRCICACVCVCVGGGGGGLKTHFLTRYSFKNHIDEGETQGLSTQIVWIHIITGLLRSQLLVKRIKGWSFKIF